MIAAQVTAREIRKRLMNPPNGRQSSHLEIISAPEIRRRATDAASEQRQQEADEAARAVMASIDRLRTEIAERQDQIAKLRATLASPPLTVTEIVGMVCHVLCVSREDILSDRRNAIIVYPRHIAMYLASTLTSGSLPSIGRRLGGKDHTTVLHAIRRTEERMKVDIHLAADVDNIKWELGIR